MKVFERLFEACEIARFTPEEKLEAEGMAEGLVEGEARGKAKGLAEVARAMKAKGLGMALIAELTGLPEEEIRKS